MSLEGEIYGFIAMWNNICGPDIDMPPLGEATVLANRVVTYINGKFFRFPIFTETHSAEANKYNLYLLYVPKLCFQSNISYVNAYLESMLSGKPNDKIRKLKDIVMENDSVYYETQKEDIYFKSSLSKFCGIGNDFAVITRRITKNTGDIKYEIFYSSEIKIEKNVLSSSM